MRQEIKNQRYKQGSAVQKARAQSADEIRQLKATAQALRQELELLRFEMDDVVQLTVEATQDEITQLKDKAAELRERLERVTTECEDRIQELARDFCNEKKRLHKIFGVLNDDLEEAPVAGEPVEEQDG